MTKKSIKNEAELKKLLTTSKEPLLLQFSASWCRPCKMITPEVEKLVEEYPNITYVYIDIDAHEEIGTRFEVQTIPLFLWYVNNRKVDSMTGIDMETFATKMDRVSNLS